MSPLRRRSRSPLDWNIDGLTSEQRSQLIRFLMYRARIYEIMPSLLKELPQIWATLNEQDVEVRIVPPPAEKVLDLIHGKPSDGVPCAFPIEPETDDPAYCTRCETLLDNHDPADSTLCSSCYVKGGAK